jgi:spoIIIJ-associated protein
MEPVDRDDSQPGEDHLYAVDPDSDREPALLPGDDDQDAEAYEGDSPVGDDRAEMAFTFLSDVLLKMQMDVVVRRRKPREDSGPDEVRLEIIGRDAGRIIGKKGQVLAALQYLVSRVVNRPGQPRRHVVLDAEGYRERREASLATMARRLGQQAAHEGKIITFEPMNPRDRRVVHLALATFADVVTRSDGEGEDRRVKIIPVRK